MAEFDLPAEYRPDALAAVLDTEPAPQGPVVRRLWAVLRAVIDWFTGRRFGLAVAEVWVMERSPWYVRNKLAADLRWIDGWGRARG